MFTIDCPRHQARVLLGSRAIEAIDDTPDGIVVHWCCRCGARGTLATGRPSATTVGTTRPAAAAA